MAGSIRHSCRRAEPSFRWDGALEGCRAQPRVSPYPTTPRITKPGRSATDTMIRTHRISPVRLACRRHERSSPWPRSGTLRDRRPELIRTPATRCFPAEAAGARRAGVRGYPVDPTSPEIRGERGLSARRPLVSSTTSGLRPARRVYFAAPRAGLDAPRLDELLEPASGRSSHGRGT